MKKKEQNDLDILLKLNLYYVIVRHILSRFFKWNFHSTRSLDKAEERMLQGNSPLLSSLLRLSFFCHSSFFPPKKRKKRKKKNIDIFFPFLSSNAVSQESNLVTTNFMSILDHASDIIAIKYGLCQ